MSTVTVSPKYQIVIPLDVRTEMNIKPGQKMAVLKIGRSLHLVPIRPIKEMRGVAKGLPTTGFREKKDRAL
jgi:AbrB family looped-hinge helix DNA binding protein